MKRDSWIGVGVIAAVAVGLGAAAATGVFSGSSKAPVPHMGVAAGATGPTGSGSQLCRDPANPNVAITCPYLSSGLPTDVNIPLDDIDRQTRPFKDLKTNIVWIPVMPSGCPANLAADAGADERYEVGCEPVADTWYNQSNPSQVLRPDGSVSSVGSPDPVKAAAQLVTWHTTLLQGTLYKSYAKANPKESATLETWWATPTLPLPAPATFTGKSILAAEEAYHYDVGDHP
jgi:hypothetical protein